MNYDNWKLADPPEYQPTVEELMHEVDMAAKACSDGTGTEEDLWEAEDRLSAALGRDYD